MNNMNNPGQTKVKNCGKEAATEKHNQYTLPTNSKRAAETLRILVPTCSNNKIHNIWGNRARKNKENWANEFLQVQFAQ